MNYRFTQVIASQPPTERGGRRLALCRVAQICCLALVCLALVWGHAGCAKQPDAPAQQKPASARHEPQGQVIATVGQVQITSADLQAEFDALPAAAQMRFGSPDQRKQLLQRVVERELLAQEAIRRGLSRDPAVTARFKRAMAEAMATALRQELVALGDITEADVREHYEAHRADFTQDFDRERDGVRNQLFELRRSEALKSHLKGLREGAKIEINEQRLAAIAQPTGQPETPTGQPETPTGQPKTPVAPHKPRPSASSKP